MEFVVAQLMAAVTGLTTFVLKIASRCNLACRYCYMYTGADQTWRALPVFMDTAVLEDVFADIVQYCQTVRLTSISLILHGGEPLLYPLDAFERLFQATHVLTAAGIEVNFALQTNATRIEAEKIALLVRHGVKVGVSLDLSPTSHDRNRVDPRGHGTLQRTLGGIATLRSLTDGLEPASALAVIDPEVPPQEAFETLNTHGFELVDLLLPDENWDTADEAVLGARFGSWLQDFFSLYCSQERRFQVRWFQTAFKLASGGSWGSDSLGLRGAGTVIVDADGSYHFHDVLRLAPAHVNATAVTAGQRRLHELAATPTMELMMRKESGLHPSCARCQVKRICGGGHIAHRYSADQGFANPSIYCAAIKPLYQRITTISNIS